MSTQPDKTGCLWALNLLFWQVVCECIRAAAIVTTIILVARWFGVIWL